MYTVSFTHSHTNTHTYVLSTSHKVRKRLLEVLFALFIRIYKHLLCTCTNIPIITPHTYAHSNTHVLYAQRNLISKCFLILNSINVRKIFLNLKHQVYGTSTHLNHCTWHIKVHKSLCMAHKCTKITAHSTPVYQNYCKWHTSVPKLIHMAHQCIQITANGTPMYPNYCTRYINVSKSGTLFLPMLKCHGGICNIMRMYLKLNCSIFR